MSDDTPSSPKPAATTTSDFVPDILVIDIAGLAYAALHTPLGKLSHKGSPTGAIHGALVSVFTRMNLRPGAVPFVLWDRRATWRHEMYPEYKAGRHVGDEKQRLRAEYKLQVPSIQLILSALGIPRISCGESEADDLVSLSCGSADWRLAQELASDHGLDKLIKLARTTLAPWSKGWNQAAIAAVDAALHAHRYQAVPKPGAVHASLAVAVHEDELALA